MPLCKVERRERRIALREQSCRFSAEVREMQTLASMLDNLMRDSFVQICIMQDENNEIWETRTMRKKAYRLCEAVDA
eukprot:8179105-Pyramimonas_sp.AAC.1